MAEGDLVAYYEYTAAGLQFLVAALVLAASPRSRLHQAFAALFALNGLITLNLQLVLAPPRVQLLSAGFLDTFTGLLLLYVLAQFPAPLPSRRARQALRVALPAWGAAWVAFYIAVGGQTEAMSAAEDALHTLPLVAAAAVLFFHTIPAYLRLQRGPLQTQTCLVAAALGLHFVRLTFSSLRGVLFDPGADQTAPYLLAALAPAAGYAATRLLQEGARSPDHRAKHWFLAVFLVAGAAYFVVDRLFTLRELSLYVVRPLFVAYAMARFDLFSAPAGARRLLVPAAAGAFLLLAFLVALRALGGDNPPGVGLTAADAVGALLAAALVGAAAMVLAPRLGLTRGADPERIEAYRLALERARLEPPSPEREARLAALRRRLGVREEEHDTLALLLEKHVFVPAGSIAALQPGQVLAGRYEVLRELGRGGFGRALLAKDREGGALVVVKELLAPWVDDAAGHRAALRREFEAARGIGSPHVARSLALLEDGPQVRLVRAFVPGRTLREAVRERGPLSPAEAARVLGDVLAGLEALHAKGVLHLDLKPENVVLDERGRAVLIDFGAARTARAAGGATVGAPTLSQPRAGTLAWMAPEQVLGKGVDARTDVYQAGALLHFLLAGRAHVREEASAYELERAIVEGGPPRLPAGVPGPLREAVLKAMAHDPAARFASTKAMAAAMAARPGPSDC